VPRVLEPPLVCPLPRDTHTAALSGAQIPLHVAIRETSDAGTPIVASQPAGEAAAAYVSVAERVWAKLQEADARREEGKGK